MIVDPEPYTGPFVTLRADGIGYRTNIEPRLTDGLDRCRTYSTKDAAWGYARDLWQEHRLPFRDYTDGNTGQCHHRKERAD